MSNAEEELDRYNLQSKYLLTDDEWTPDWIDDDDRTNKNNPWLISSETDWINTLYSQLYPLPKSLRHKATFTNIILNLSLRRSMISTPLSKVKHKDTYLPSTFLPSSVSEITNELHRRGYVVLHRGHKNEGARGTRSTIEPTDALLSLIPPGMTYAIHEEGLVVPKGFIPESFPPYALEVRELLKEYNKTVEYENMLYATHKGSFDIDGRFTGSSVQLMRSQDRKNIKIDGEDTIEIDISNCIPFLLTASVLGRGLNGDAYKLDGIPRKLAKTSFLITINSKSREKAQNAIQLELNFKYKLDRNATYILNEIERVNPDLVEFLYKENGRSLMFEESRCMAKFVRSMLDKGIKFYPIYDSVRVPLSKRDIATEELKKAFTVGGVEPVIHED